MLDIIIKGSWMMVPLLVESVLALAVFMDRFVAFRANARTDTRTLRAKVMALLEQDRAEEALDLCFSTPGPVSAVLAAGIQSYVKHRSHAKNVEMMRGLIEDAMEDYTHHALAAVEKRMNVLAFVGNSAPLFGMTGTVTGMIKSFNAMAGAGALEGTVVAAGISEALITTAAGLLIALGAVIPYHYFTGNAAKIESEILEAASDLLDFVTVRHAGGTEAGV